MSEEDGKCNLLCNFILIDFVISVTKVRILRDLNEKVRRNLKRRRKVEKGKERLRKALKCVLRVKELLYNRFDAKETRNKLWKPRL